VSADDGHAGDENERAVQVDVGGKRRAAGGGKDVQIHPFGDGDADQRGAQQPGHVD
jgi:hypothetical protein